MRCKTIRVMVETSEDDGKSLVVAMVVGNMRRVGAIDEVAWIEMPPSMARQIAADLIKTAYNAERG